MATFSYIAKRSDGSEARGSINAATADAAREELRKRGLMIEDLRESAPPQRKPQPAPASFKPSPKPGTPQRTASAAPPKPVQPQSTPAAAPAKPAPLPWSAGHGGSAPKQPAASLESDYAPLHETLRIFAGWLLAWYGLIYALGFLEQTDRLPELPFVRELFESRLVLQFTFGTFLLLALSNLHRWLGKGLALGFALSIAWVALMAGFVWYG